jgi:CubicO group peptidase (beta-lactamase class C family)
MVGGELVVDLWGGTIGDAGEPWTEHTIINVWSVTKTMTNVCALLLADRGYLDLEAPVGRYWPEFAGGTKAAIAVRHLLGHTAGLPGWDVPVQMEDLSDWDRMTGLLAAQEVWWEPGTRSGYHALTQGYLVGEVVRRVTGQTLGDFFRSEIAAPLQSDFHIGLPAKHDARVAPVIPPSELLDPGPDSDSVANRTLTNPRLRADFSGQAVWRRAEIPAANGHGNARSVAAVQSVVSGGGYAGGQRFLSEAGCSRIFDGQADGIDLVLGQRLKMGLGFGLRSDHTPIGRNPRVCFWGGWGGSIVVNDLDARLTVAYVMNRMSEGTMGDRRGLGLIGAVYRSLEDRE